MVACPPSDQCLVGLNPDQVIPRTVDTIPIASLLGTFGFGIGGLAHPMMTWHHCHVIISGSGDAPPQWGTVGHIWRTYLSALCDHSDFNLHYVETSTTTA